MIKTNENTVGKEIVARILKGITKDTREAEAEVKIRVDTKKKEVAAKIRKSQVPLAIKEK